MRQARAKLRSIKLELLRHGQAHNQLLSPLTRYMALSGDHEACVVHVPYTHEKFLISLRALRYQDRDDSTRRAQLDDMADAMGAILGSVPGLIADLAPPNMAEETFTHLRLVFSAAELALMPFELASAPSGFPGEGAPLALQLEAPLTITREVRAAASRPIEWPKHPRILFAVAAPRGGIESRLVDSHIQGLRQALVPFARHGASGIAELLDVLPNASLRSIERACRRVAYTHVHILAHGRTVDDSLGEKRFGLALHDGAGGADDVDGDRLASALRSHREEAGSWSTLSHPTVVTVAACDSGQQGSVLVPGSSLAHSLHAAGVPLVVASQFPLTKRGSVLIPLVLYKRMLWGEDPRIVLHDLRQRLKGLDRSSHDWASLVCHAALPTDLEDQLTLVTSVIGKRAINVAVAEGWSVRKNWLEKKRELGEKPPEKSFQDATRAAFDKSLAKLERAVKRVPASDLSFEEPIQEDLDRQTDVLNSVGNAQLLEAELLYLSVTDDLPPPDKVGAPTPDCMEVLRLAKQTYARAWRLNPGSTWAGSVYLSLKRVVEGEVDVDLWRAVGYCIQDELHIFHKDHERHRWARANQLELFFHALYTPKLADDRKRLAEAGFALRSDKLKKTARNLVRTFGRDSLQVGALGQQFQRFGFWWKISGRHSRLALDLRDIFWYEELES